MVRQVDPPGGRQLRRLVTGLVHRTPGGAILLERPGPFLPPVTLPSVGLLVVTSAVRAAVDDAGLQGFTWLPVVKHHIARLAWAPVPYDQRRLAAPVPDPESFLVQAPHDPAVAEALGDLWAADAPSVGVGEPFDLDFFRVANRVWLFVSERCRKVLEAEALGWLDFQNVLMRAGSE